MAFANHSVGRAGHRCGTRALGAGINGTGLLAFVLCATLLSSLPVRCEDVIKVGIHDKPPFASKSENGEWEGIGVKIWKEVALQTGLKYEFVETPYEDILPAVADGRLQAAIGEIEITAEAEKTVNFTQPYIQSSTGIALRQGAWHPDWMAISRDFFNWSLVQVLLLIFAGLFIVSFLIWIFERNHHLGHFRGGLSGFGSALWFSATTMTTVGYGDKTPSTFWGRIVSFVWMLAGVLLVASFTASVASSIATARISDMIIRPGDLFRVSCGTLEGSVSQQYLRNHGIPSRAYETIEDALRALSKGEIEAVVADRIALNFLSGKMSMENPPVRFSVSNVSFQEVFIGIPVHPGFSGYEAINVAVLKTTSSPEWQDTIRRWLGGGNQ